MNMIVCGNCGERNGSNHKYCAFCGYELSKSIESSKQVYTANSHVRKKKQIGVAVGVVISFVLFWCTLQQLLFKVPIFDKTLVQMANEVNTTCPIMIDQYTSLDNVLALPDNTLQYNYTLIDIDQLIDYETLKKNMEPVLIENVKSNPDMKLFREKEITFIHYYRDKKGVFVMKISVTPDMYKELSRSLSV